MLVPYFQVLATMLIAAAAYSIGRQQQKTNEQRLKHELYDRRFEIYRLVDEAINAYFLSINVMMDQSKIPDFRKNLVEARQKAHFLCCSEKDYIVEINKKISKLERIRKRLESTNTRPDEEQQNLYDEQDQLTEWLDGQRAELAGRFEKYLSLG